jgi:hypothetical protein
VFRTRQGNCEAPSDSRAIRILKDASIAIAVALACALVAAHALGIGSTPLDVPYTYDGDGLFYAALFKGVIDNGWYLSNPFLGAPFGLDMSPFPMVDGTHFILIYLISLFTHEFGEALSIFQLLSYCTSAISAYIVMRLLGVDRPLSACGAFLFSLQFYHFVRGTHVFLASYFCVPILIWFALTLCNLPKRSANSGISILGLAALLFAASGCGIYYSFFGCLLICYGAVSASVEQHDWRPIRIGIVTIAIAIAGVFINLSPYFSSDPNHEKYLDASRRRPEESEIYGLRLTQLALPSPGHRNAYMREIATRYDESAPNVNENWSASLGLVALSGFLASIFSFLLLRSERRSRLASSLGAMNLLAFLYGTIGGLGAIFARIVTPELRGLNRISIFISFISLSYLMLSMSGILAKRSPPRFRFALSVGAALFMASFGYWDQVPDSRPRATERSRASFESDKAVGQAIMNHLPAGAHVYQLPYVSYPEGLPNFKEGGYSLLRRYLHTQNISWSFGAMRGREDDDWIRAKGSLPMAEQLRKLAGSGFDAVLIERTALADAGKSLEDMISPILGPPIMICPDSSCSLFRLEGSGTDNSSPFLYAARGAGFSAWESGPDGLHSASSIGESGNVLLLNPLNHGVMARLQLTVSIPGNSTLEARMDGKTLQVWHQSNTEPNRSVLKFELAPGTNVLNLHATAGTQANTSPDSGKIQFQLENLSISPTDTAEQALVISSQHLVRDRIF